MHCREQTCIRDTAILLLKACNCIYKRWPCTSLFHAQVGGFLQRIDYVRKYAFGVMCILKNSEGQFPIRGFWIFRGQDIPQMMKDECYDLELYDWKKLDGKALEPVSVLLSSMLHSGAIAALCPAHLTLSIDQLLVEVMLACVIQHEITDFVSFDWMYMAQMAGPQQLFGH